MSFVFQGKTTYVKPNKDIAPLLLSNPCVKGKEVINDSFLGRGLTAPKKPHVDHRVIAINDTFLSENQDIREIKDRYRCTSDCDPTLNQPQNSLKTLFSKEKHAPLDEVKEAISILLTMALDFPKTGNRFDEPTINTESIMSVRVSPTAMGPLNYITQDQELNQSIIYAKKTDFTHIQKELVDYDMQRLDDGLPPVVRPFALCVKNEVVKKDRPMRVIYPCSAVSYRECSLIWQPISKAITSSINKGTTLGLTQEADMGNKIHRRMKPYFNGKAKPAFMSDFQTNEAYKSLASSLVIPAYISGMYNLSDRSILFINSMVDEYVTPRLLVGNTIIAAPSGTMGSGGFITRDGNDKENKKTNSDILVHHSLRDDISNELMYYLIRYTKSHLEGGDDKLGAAPPEHLRDDFLSVWRQFSERENRPFSFMDIKNFHSKLTPEGRLDGVEFNKRHFVEYQGNTFFTRSLEGVARKAHFFKTDTTLVTAYSGIIKDLEQMPGNYPLFKRYTNLADTYYNAIIKSGLYLDNSYWVSYQQVAKRRSTMGMPKISFEDVNHLNMGHYNNHIYDQLNNMATDKYGVSMHVFTFKKNAKAVTDENLARAQLIMDDVKRKLADLTDVQFQTIISNVNAYQGALRQQVKTLTESVNVRTSYLTELNVNTINFLDHHYRTKLNIKRTGKQAVQLLVASRTYRSQFTSTDRMSRRIEVPNDSYLNTHAKFAKAIESSGITSKQVLHLGSGDIGMRSIQGIIQQLSPLQVICVDKQATEAKLTYNQTQVIYIRRDASKFIGDTRFGEGVVLISDLSIGDDEGQVNIKATNKVNREVAANFNKKIVKWFYDPEGTNPNLTYKHLAHNLEYFTTMESELTGEDERTIIDKIVDSNLLRNKICHDRIMIPSGKGHHYAPLSPTDLELEVPTVLHHSNMYDVQLHRITDSTMTTLSEDGDQYQATLWLVVDGTFNDPHVEAMRPPPGSLRHAVIDTTLNQKKLASYANYLSKNRSDFYVTEDEDDIVVINWE